MSRNSRNEPLLNIPMISDENSSQKCKFQYKSYVILFIIFLALAPIAWVLSELFINYYGYYFTIPSPRSRNFILSDTSATTKKFIIPMISTTASSRLSGNNSQELPPAANCGKRIVGYYTEWEPRKIAEKQLKKLTHLIFTNIPMNASGYVNYQSMEQRRRFLDMRNKTKSLNHQINVMFAIGGHLNSQYYSTVLADPEKRKSLIDSIAVFIKTNEMDGVDLFWEWPKKEDMNSYSNLVKELRIKLTSMENSERRSDHYLLSIVVPHGPHSFDGYFDLDGFLDYVDFINIVSYGYYAPWNGERGELVGPNAPLYGGNQGNVDETMRYLICKTKRPSKLNMAVSFYGRYWMNVKEKIQESDEMWRTAELKNGRAEGTFVAWKNMEKQGWNKSEALWHEETRIPYIWKPKKRIFFVFENERSLKEKMDYAMDSNIGGIYIWALGADDEEDTLLNVVSSANLCTGGTGDNINFMCNF